MNPNSNSKALSIKVCTNSSIRSLRYFWIRGVFFIKCLSLSIRVENIIHELVEASYIIFKHVQFISTVTITVLKETLITKPPGFVGTFCLGTNAHNRFIMKVTLQDVLWWHQINFIKIIYEDHTYYIGASWICLAYCSLNCGNIMLWWLLDASDQL